MPKKRDRGLTWLDPSDLDQIEWAANYLQERRMALQEYSRRLKYERLSFMDLIHIGDDFEREIDGGGLLADSLIKLLQDMKGAARAAKMRKKQKKSGARKIKIGSEASSRLAVLAKMEAMSEEIFLEKLIDRSYKAKERAEKRNGTHSKLSTLPPIHVVSVEELKSHFCDEDQSPHSRKPESPLPSPLVSAHIEKATSDKCEATEATSVTGKSEERDSKVILEAEAAVFFTSPDALPPSPLSESSDALVSCEISDSRFKADLPKSPAQTTIMEAMRAKAKVKQP